MSLQAINQRLHMLDPNNIASIVREIQHDIIDGKHPDNAAVTHALSVGELKTIPNWTTDPLVLNDLIGAVLGRVTQAICLEHSIDPLDLSIDQIISLAAATNSIQQRTLNLMTLS